MLELSGKAGVLFGSDRHGNPFIAMHRWADVNSVRGRAKNARGVPVALQGENVVWLLNCFWCCKSMVAFVTEKSRRGGTAYGLNAWLECD